jgi:hypothetical protein
MPMTSLVICQVVHPLKNSLYDDWEVVESIWNHIFRCSQHAHTRTPPIAYFQSTLLRVLLLGPYLCQGPTF